MGNHPSDHKTIMIFGAGINQLELIRAARMMKITSVVLDPSLNPPGKAESDFFYQVGGADYETTKEIALKHKVNGIVTGQMEKPLRLMARLAKDLGLIFHSSEVVERSLDKWLMKDRFIINNIPCARGILLLKDEKLKEKKTREFKFPLIIKPRDAFSSRGVYKVDSFSDLKNHLDESRSFASKGDVIIEEFLEGGEFSVETITYRGVSNIIQFTEKFITPYPYTVEMAHFQPADLTAKEKDLISSLVINGIDALGIDNSAAHTEVMLTQDGPIIIEIGARLGGDFISSYLTKSSTGVSMDKAAISIALGLPPDLNPAQNYFSYIKYLELPPGKIIKKILQLDNLRKLPGVAFAWVFLREGDVIMPIIHSALRPACILVKAGSHEEIISLADKYINELKKLILLN
jgi:carbamoyl-phosphate synthase large subunit